MENRDTISINDITDQVLQNHELASSQIKETFDSYLDAIRIRARDHARRLIGRPKVGRVIKRIAYDDFNKFDDPNVSIYEAYISYPEKDENGFLNGFTATHLMQWAIDEKNGETLEDVVKATYPEAFRIHIKSIIRKASIKRIAGTFEDSVNQAFDAIDGIPQEIIQKIKDEWMQSGGQQNLIPQLIKKEVDEYEEEGHTKKELREALHSLWEKQKTVYKRIVRTTTINTYAKAQLEEWDADGIIEVERHCIDDHRTCQICRALCAPGRNRYKIKELLGFDDPITYASHPQCRDFYTPVVDWESLNEYFTEPLVDVETDDVQISNLPAGFQQQVDELSNRIDLGGVIEFVPDIVDSPEWQESRYNEYRDMGYGQREALQVVEMDREQLRGQIVTFEHPEKTLISGQAVDASSFAYSMVVSKSAELWKEADKAEVRALYEERLASDEPFITFDAEANAQSYFIESYTAFVTNPFRLLTLDLEMYDLLAKLTGQDFFQLGAVR